jgi:hypothetical protein
MYTYKRYKWCNKCQINNLRQYFANCISGNEKIDELIQEMQLKIKNCNDVIVEWIPYNQFNNIKIIGKDDFATLNSAIWIDGSLEYNYDKMKWKRIPKQEVVLKYFGSSQNSNITDEFLNEV